jgi:hypothetical protein
MYYVYWKKSPSKIKILNQKCEKGGVKTKLNLFLFLWVFNNFEIKLKYCSI